jgi:hypothetical protein
MMVMWVVTLRSFLRMDARCPMLLIYTVPDTCCWYIVCEERMVVMWVVTLRSFLRMDARCPMFHIDTVPDTCDW